MILMRRSWLPVTIIVTVALGSAPLNAADVRPKWLTGSDFQQKLALPAAILWTDSPLGEYLLDFGQTQRIAVLLDRRVDPDQKLSLAVREKTVLAVVQAVAVNRNLQASVLRNVVYVGPPGSAARIRTVAELRRQEIAAMGTGPSLKFAKQAPIAWRDLDSPRSLLHELTKRNGLAIVNLDLVPHDLWAAGELPAMSLTERLTLILHQFDLTFQVASDARRVAIRPVPPDVAVVRDYPGGSKSETLAEKWRATRPNCEFRITGNRIHVRGLIEDHEVIEEMRTSGGKQAAGPRANRKPDLPLKQVFTAEVPNQPLGDVLSHFAGQLGLELDIDRASLQNAGVTLDRLISFRVEEATMDELFRAVLTPVGCTHERRGNVLKVWAKP